MLSFKKIISLPYRIARFFILEFYSTYYEVFTDFEQLLSFIRIQVYILPATIIIGVFAISLGNLKPIFIVYIIGMGIIIGFFAHFFLVTFSDKGVDVLWGFGREPSTDELAQPYFDMVELAMREERYESALLLLEKILELDAKQLKALMKIAQIYHYNLNNYTKALSIYKKVLNIIGWEEQDNFYYIESKKGISEIMKRFYPQE